VPLYFASDQHICLRHPERGRRFARFLGLLDPASDRLVIAGDLCDFWFVAREAHTPEAEKEPGIAALKRFVQAGGEVTLLPGNHDMHLEWFYRKELGIGYCDDLNLNLDSRDEPGAKSMIRIVHGHLLGGRSRWKGWMESRGFLSGFRCVPSSIADRLAALLQKYNSRNRRVDNLRHFRVFETHVKNARPSGGQGAGDSSDHYDIYILGHVHQTFCVQVDASDQQSTGETDRKTLMVVLGHWFRQASWFRIDPDLSHGFYIWNDDSPEPELVTDARILPPL